MIPRAISYQVELRSMVSLLRTIHQEDVLWRAPAAREARRARLATVRYLQLLQESMSDQDSMMTGELRRSGNRIEGFLEFNENGLKPIGATIADAVKSLQ